jgi:glycosyltransferase involved in cell wall biosynthesis
MGSSRYRTFQYLPYLQNRGFDCDVVPFFSDGDTVRIAEGRPRSVGSLAVRYATRASVGIRESDYDAVVIEKEIFPFLPRWAERLAGFGTIPFAVDYDDATFHTYDRHRMRGVRSILGRKIPAIMRQASMVLAGNAYIAERARRTGAREVVVLPTVVDLDRYPGEPAVRRSERIRIAWIGSPSSARYLRMIEETLAEVCAGLSAEVVVIGTAETNGFRFPFQWHPWREETEVSLLRSCDVGIMPLPDEPWARGKCGLKLLQYMACHLPVVTSPVGVNIEIVRHGQQGFLVSSPEEWRRALASLAGDPELRLRMGRQGRSVVEKKYCLAVAAPVLSGVLERLVAEGRRSRKSADGRTDRRDT